MGKCKEIIIKVIPSSIANPFVKKHHYSGKVVANSVLHFGTSNNALPQYSSTSSAYIRKDGERYVQIREYHNRLVQKDIDLFVENNHTNKNGEELDINVVHVHDWFKNKKGEWKRRYDARYLTEEEISKWGNLIKMIKPEIKLRP